MTRYTKSPQISEQTRAKAIAVARSTQKPGQTKEQTKLIAQGIQKGIDAYKTQQKAKSRELNKRLKNAAATTNQPAPSATAPADVIKPAPKTRLPWVLLALSWALFALYFVVEFPGQ
jgi:hypothetical protein